MSLNIERNACLYTVDTSTLTRLATNVSRNTEVRSLNHFCRGKAIRIIYSECVSVAKRMCHIMSPAASLALLYFPMLFHERHDL
jgi:hypothetical protein